MSYGYSDALEISGLEELQTKLTAFGEKVVNEVVQTGLNEGAKIFQAEAIQNAINIGNDKEHNLKVDGTYIKLQQHQTNRS